MAICRSNSRQRSHRTPQSELGRAFRRRPIRAAAAVPTAVATLLLALTSGLVWTLTRGDTNWSTAGAAPTVPAVADPATSSTVTVAPPSAITVTVSVMGGGAGMVSHVSNKQEADRPDERADLPWEQTVTVGPDDHMVISGTPENPDSRLICSIQVNGQLVTSDDTAVSGVRYCSAAASNEDLRTALRGTVAGEP